jgi:hypothetical protein
MRIGGTSARGLAILLLTCGAVTPVWSGNVNGSARVYTVSTDAEAGDQDQLSQNYSLNYRQPLTPFLEFLFSFQGSRLDTESEFTDFERTSQEPTLELAYRKESVSGRIGYRDRDLGGSVPTQDLDIKQVFGLFSWKPARGPQYSLRFFDTENVADVAVFGRDTDTTTLGFDVNYSASNL